MYKDDEIKFLNILAQNHDNCDCGDDPFREGLAMLFSILGTVPLRRTNDLYLSATISQLIAHNISERMMHSLHSCGWFAYEEDEDSGIYYIAFEG
jgi:hypothetical protein